MVVFIDENELQRDLLNPWKNSKKLSQFLSHPFGGIFFIFSIIPENS